jgi:hypothetical protein
MLTAHIIAGRCRTEGAAAAGGGQARELHEAAAPEWQVDIGEADLEFDEYEDMIGAGGQVMTSSSSSSSLLVMTSSSLISVRAGRGLQGKVARLHGPAPPRAPHAHAPTLPTAAEAARPRGVCWARPRGLSSAPPRPAAAPARPGGGEQADLPSSPSRWR